MRERLEVADERCTIGDGHAGRIFDKYIDDFHRTSYRRSASSPAASRRPPSNESYPSREASCSSGTALSPPPERSDRPRRLRNETATDLRHGQSPPSTIPPRLR